MKTAPWILVAPGTVQTAHTVVLDPSEARHLTGALRRRPGDGIVLVDGEGWLAEARLIAIERGRVEAEVMSIHHEPEPQPGGVTLALASVGSRAMDWAVQKAVEIGVRRIVPMETERSQIRGRDLGRRIGHWQRISVQALKQCRRLWAMEVAEAATLAALVDSESVRGGGVVADRDGCAIGELPETAGTLLVVGPEGGFTAAEKKLFDRHDWPRLRLGPNVLRSETAAVIGGALLVSRLENS